MATPPIQALGPTELTPGLNVTDDEELEKWIRGVLNPSNAHECCTTPNVKTEWGGVVDNELLVYGVEGLRVVGISTWPLSPGSAPSATVYAVAEKVSVVSVVAEKSEKSMLMNKLGCRYD